MYVVPKQLNIVSLWFLVFCYMHVISVHQLDNLTSVNNGLNYSLKNSLTKVILKKLKDFKSLSCVTGKPQIYPVDRQDSLSMLFYLFFNNFRIFALKLLNYNLKLVSKIWLNGKLFLKMRQNKRSKNNKKIPKRKYSE